MKETRFAFLATVLPLLLGSAGLVDGNSKPQIENAVSIEFDQWPKSLQELATRLGALAAEELK